MPEFLQPTSMAEAMSLLEEKQGLRFLGGGTDLIVQMREKLVHPACLMDVKKIPELQVFQESQDGLEIGAAVTCNAILEADLSPQYRVLQEAAATLANTLLRNRATLVGNLCNASPGGDMIPACLVLDAKLFTASPEGGREIPLRDFFVGVKKHVLKPDELVVKVVFPATGGVGAYRKKQRIRGHDLAQVGVAGFRSTDGTVSLAFGAVGPTPIFVGDLPAPASAAERESLLNTCVSLVKPISDVRSSREYRLAMVHYLTGQVLDALFGVQEVDE